MNMSTIAFIGLGIMGLPMAGHLIDAGHRVVGHNRTPDRIAALVERGGTAAKSAAEAACEADIVAVMVPDSPDVLDVLTGDGGVFDAVKPGTLIIDFSSIRPDVTVELAAHATQRGLRLIDAPVSGGEAGAVNAALSIMVGGEAADFEAARPILDTVGKTVMHVGPNGAGQTVKAANQLIVAGNIQLVAEALALVEAYGVDTDAALTVLGGGLAGSAVLNQKRDNTREHTPRRPTSRPSTQPASASRKVGQIQRIWQFTGLAPTARRSGASRAKSGSISRCSAGPP
jgi:2-hydroxy-3-oxopropionate reductase